MTDFSPHPAPAHRHFTANLALEFLLTLAVCAALYRLAQPLGLSGVDQGLGGRYVEQNTLREWRAIQLLRNAGAVLTLLGMMGWMALQCARHGRSDSNAFGFALWAVVAYLLQPFGIANTVWAGLAAVTAVVAVVLYWRGRKATPALSMTVLTPFTACVWPGWMLFTGVSCLIAMDFAARGPVGLSLEVPKDGARFFGVFQADGLWLASGLLLAMVAFRQPLLRGWVGVCNTLAALWLRPRGPFILIAFFAILAVALGWIGYFDAGKGRAFLGIHIGGHGLLGLGKSHITGEILRLAACAVLAWSAYRVGEWQTSPQRAWLSLRGLLLVLILCCVGLVTSDDKGPLLILALAVFLLRGVPLMQRLRRRAFIVPLVVCISALSTWRFVLVQLFPSFSADAARRVSMMLDFFHATSPNLAQARWLMDATPSGGFGLARVPYCGAQALVGQGACTLGSGSPLQMASDLAYVPLYATWGTWGAGALIVLLLLWLFALPAGQLAAWHANHGGNAAHMGLRKLSLLPVWLVAVPCLAAQAQTLVSVGAVLGWSPLSGVTLPLLGYGTSALCAAAVWVGLAAHATQEISP